MINSLCSWPLRLRLIQQIRCKQTLKDGANKITIHHRTFFINKLILHANTGLGTENDETNSFSSRDNAISKLITSTERMITIELTKVVGIYFRRFLLLQIWKKQLPVRARI
jgi:hypothetical protein